MPVKEEGPGLANNIKRAADKNQIVSFGTAPGKGQAIGYRTSVFGGNPLPAAIGGKLCRRASPFNRGSNGYQLMGQRQDGRENTRCILVPHDPGNHNKPPARQIAQGFGQGVGPRRIVRTIEENGGRTGKKLHPARPAGVGYAGAEHFIRKSLAVSGEKLGSGKGSCGVYRLIAPPDSRFKSGKISLYAMIQKAVRLPARAEVRPETYQGAVEIAAPLLNSQKRLLGLGRKHHRPPRLDDAGLFPGNIRQGISKPLTVIYSYGGDDRKGAAGNAGGIGTATHPCFENGNVHMLFGKIEQRHGGYDFKKGGTVRSGCQDLPGKTADCISGNLGAVNADPFGKSGEMGGGKETGPTPARSHDGRQKSRRGTLAVGPGHVDGPQPLMGIAQPFKQSLDPRQPRFYPEAAQAIDICKGFLVGHDRAGLYGNSRGKSTALTCPSDSAAVEH